MDFAPDHRTLAAGKRHKRPLPPTFAHERRRRIRAILARTAASRRELDARIAGAPAMPEYDDVPITYSLGDWRSPPPKPAPKKLVPKWKRKFLLRDAGAPDDNTKHGAGDQRSAGGEEKREEDPRASEAAAQDHCAA